MVRVDVLLHGEPVDAFSTIVHRSKSYAYGKKMTERLRELIPRQLFDVAIRGDRFEDHRARDGQGEAQGRAGQVLRRRHHRKRKLLEEQKKEGAAAEGRKGGCAAGGVHRTPGGGGAAKK